MPGGVLNACAMGARLEYALCTDDRTVSKLPERKIWMNGAKDRRRVGPQMFELNRRLVRRRTSGHTRILFCQGFKKKGILKKTPQGELPITRACYEYLLRVLATSTCCENNWAECFLNPLEMAILHLPLLHWYKHSPALSLALPPILVAKGEAATVENSNSNILSRHTKKSQSRLLISAVNGLISTAVSFLLVNVS